MILNKLWFILVALAASVALTIALVAPRSAGRQLQVTEAVGLDRAQYAADQMLKNDSRRWIDYVAKVGRDAKVTEALENASRGTGEARMIHESVRSRLGALIPDPEAIGVRMVVAVDANGKVVAQIGEKENDYGDPVSGLEIVEDALMGYLGDSVWGTEGKLTRVAAAPVLAKTQDRVVGAILVGVATDDRLAKIWQRNLGVEVAFVLGDEVITSTLPPGALGTLASAVAARRAEIKVERRTAAFPLPLGTDQLLAVAAPFAGEAESMGGHYVLLQKRKTVDGPFALLVATSKDDLSWNNFPWIPLSLCVVGMLGIGLFLQRREIERPLKRLRTQMQKLARGEIQKLDDGSHPGRFGGIARDVNSTIERFTHGEGPQSATNRKDLNQILDGDGRERKASLPPLPPLGGPSTAWGGGGLTSPMAKPALSGFAAGGMPGSGPPHMGLTPLSGGMSAGPSSPGMGGMGALPPPQPAFAPPAPPVAAPPAARFPPAPSGPSAAPAPTPPPVSPPHQARADVGAAIKAEMDDSPTNDMNKPGDPGALEWDAHVKMVFAEYVETRARCGEATKGLTLDKFREKLDANRSSIMQKYGSKTARFSVYVKDGKAAIKAVPQK